MWTYLAILLGVGVVIGVFVRRSVLMSRVGKAPVVEQKKEESKLVEAGKEVVKKIKKRVSKSDKQKVEDLVEKADIKLKIGQEEEAIKLLVQALAINELHIEAQNKLAMLYMNKQMFAAAAALFKQLGEMTGEAVHYSHLGLALYQQKELAEALSAYQKAVDLDGTRPQRFASLAAVYRSLGNFQNAVIALNKAIELEQTNLDFLFVLADVQVEMKDFDGAVKTLNGLLEIHPENDEAKEYIKKIHAMRTAESDSK